MRWGGRSNWKRLRGIYGLYSFRVRGFLQRRWIMRREKRRRRATVDLELEIAIRTEGGRSMDREERRRSRNRKMRWMKMNRQTMWIRVVSEMMEEERRPMEEGANHQKENRLHHRTFRMQTMNDLDQTERADLDPRTSQPHHLQDQIHPAAQSYPIRILTILRNLDLQFEDSIVNIRKIHALILDWTFCYISFTSLVSPSDYPFFSAISFSEQPSASLS